MSSGPDGVHGDPDTCGVCLAARLRPKLEVRGVQILECTACGAGQWHPPPGFRARDTYEAGYFDSGSHDEGYDDYGALETSLRATFRKRLRGLGSPPPGGSALDVGAAFGFAVAEARAAGWLAVGTEVSRDAIRRAAADAQPWLVAADAGGTPFPSASFDLVTLWDVIEHLPDPHAAVAEIARVARPGGRLVLTTGDMGSLVAKVSGARWHLYSIPEHLFFHTRESLRRLLEAHSFEVEWIRTSASYYTLGYLVERLGKTLLDVNGAAGTGWPGAGLRIPVNLYDIVTVSARRVPTQ